jgi:predicted nuclease of predicted toxin-antitoxin system
VRVLLDECLPRRLKRDLVGHDVRTAPEMGWASKTNGELLALAAAEFDVFLTSDRNLSHQLNVAKFDIAVLVLVSGSNRLDDLRPLVPQIREAIVNARAGSITEVRRGPRFRLRRCCPARARLYHRSSQPEGEAYRWQMI